MMAQACGTQHQNQSQNDVLDADSIVKSLSDNSQTSVDWAGTYKGTLPCADCPGIATVVKLQENGSYVLKTHYLGRDTTVFEEQGQFAWTDNGSKISLNGDSKFKYLVGENQLFHLDQDGNRITGQLEENYRLAKMGSHIRDVYWQLIEINGQNISGIKLMKEPYLRLVTDDNRAEVNGGCNGMGGAFTLNEDNFRLRFSQMMSTQMACENMEIEEQLREILGKVDSYAVANDTLQLFRARMAPLAKYVAVYDKF